VEPVDHEHVRIDGSSFFYAENGIINASFGIISKPGSTGVELMFQTENLRKYGNHEQIMEFDVLPCKMGYVE